MDKKLSKNEFLSISLLLFALLFGSGNLIFPPMLGNQAGTSTGAALVGFGISAVFFPVLGILAVSKTEGIQNLGARVGPLFSVLYPALLFLAIGPGIAIPRNGSLAFEMSIVPYLTQESPLGLARFIYTVLFFGFSYYLCLQPGKLVDRIGKVLTPLLMGLILVFFIGAIFTLTPETAPAVESYRKPLLTGFVEGYNTMDTLASLNFGLVVAMAIKAKGVKSRKEIIKYVSGSGIFAGLILLVVYAMLAYVGKITSLGQQSLANGGHILFLVTDYVFGLFGAVILILIFTLACLTTAVGLITSVSEYFANLTHHKVTYEQWIFIYTLLSLILANFGLNAILQFSLPVLVAIYPPAIMLIVMALLQDFFHFDQLTYRMTIYSTLLFSVIAGFQSSGIEFPFISDLTALLPFYANDLEWVVPALLILIGFTIFSKVKRLKTSSSQ